MNIFTYNIHLLTYFSDQTIQKILPTPSTNNTHDTRTLWLSDMVNQKYPSVQYVPSIEDIFIVSSAEEIDTIISSMDLFMRPTMNRIRIAIGLCTKKEAKTHFGLYEDLIKRILTLPTDELKIEALSNIPTIKNVKHIIPELYLYLRCDYVKLLYCFGLNMYNHYSESELKNIVSLYIDKKELYLNTIYQENKKIIIERIRQLTGRTVDPWNDVNDEVVNNCSVIGFNYYEYNPCDIIVAQLENKIAIYERRELMAMKFSGRCIHSRQILNVDWIDYVLRCYDVLSLEFGEVANSIEENIKSLIE